MKVQIDIILRLRLEVLKIGTAKEFASIAS